MPTQDNNQQFITDLELPFSKEELEKKCEDMGLSERHTQNIVNTWEGSYDYGSFITAMNQSGNKNLLSPGHRFKI